MNQRQEQILQKWYRDYAGLVWKIAHARLGDRHEAEDVVQDVFVALSNRTDEPVNPKAWIREFAWRITEAHFREQKRHRTLPFLENAAGGEEDTKEDFASGFRGLSDDHQFVLRLRFSHGLKVVDIAEIIGHSAGDVSRQIGRAVAQLRLRVRPPSQDATLKKAR